MRLYEINQAIRDILSQVNDDGELPEDSYIELEALNMQAEIKYEAIACLIKELNITAKALKDEEYALRERRRKHENHAERLRGYLADQMLDNGMERLETAKTAITFRKSEGVVIDNEAIVPGNYYKYKPEISVSTIKDDLKAGIEVPGVHIEERKNIQIK